MKIIEDRDLDGLSRQARESPRLRKNLNLHDDYADPCQRLFNALEPGTYIRPHRHTEPPKPETFLIVRGALLLVIFDDEGLPSDAVRLATDGPNKAVDLPAGTWHMVIALNPGTVFFETKPGPYVALSDKDFAPWAPDESDPSSDVYLEQVARQVRMNRHEVDPDA